MEKVIKLIMENDKSIRIFVNDEEKHQIEENNRSIKANAIFEIMDFKLGDHYTVESINKSGVDSQVLEFFEKLISDIATKVNAIPVD